MTVMRAKSSHDVRLVVLDDCSPEPGWSDELEELCGTLEIDYYHSPRNLGIPRNMNLALEFGRVSDADHVVLLNSDVIVPHNLVDVMVGVAEADAATASVTAWSNNVSIFSLENDDPDRQLADRDVVNDISEALQAEFGTTSIDVPVGVGFCMLIPMPVAEHVGLLDPIYGRGYCEEVDWCRRAVGLGYRNVVAPGCFVYHIGNASAKEAGLLAAGATTVWEHEAIVDVRFPGYREALATFDRDNPFPALRERALRAVVKSAAQAHGYELHATWLHRRADALVRFVIEPEGRLGFLVGRYRGFSVSVPFDGAAVVESVISFVGQHPTNVNVFDRGRLAELVSEQASDWGLRIHRPAGYPERVDRLD